LVSHGPVSRTLIETRKTFGRFCHVFCGIEVDADVDNNRAIAVRPDPDSVVSGGCSCRRGRAKLEPIDHSDRLASSKTRVGEKFVDIHGQQALDEISDAAQHPHAPSRQDRRNVSVGRSRS